MGVQVGGFCTAFAMATIPNRRAVALTTSMLLLPAGPLE